MLLAAPPTWFADNAGQIAAFGLLGLTLVMLRLVQKVAVRISLLAILAALALFIYVNRVPLGACAHTCECSIAERHINVPLCEPAGSL